MQVITKDDVKSFYQNHMQEYRKKVTTKAVRITGPFRVITREGPLECPDGYLAVDSEGWPYPIHKDEFAKIYEKVSQEGRKLS